MLIAEVIKKKKKKNSKTFFLWNMTDKHFYIYVTHSVGQPSDLH